MIDTTQKNSDSSDVKVFGLPAHQGRWLLIPLGMTLSLCLGTVYSWSIFRNPIETELNLSATESLFPYTIALVFYAGLMPVAGFLIPRIGTVAVAMIGGSILGVGYILASFAQNIVMLTLTYGVMVGTGVGTAYGVPMVVMSRWFPDRKGLAVGLAIGGFGLSPLITAPLAKSLIDRFQARPTFLLLGIAFGLTILAISLTMKLPPKEWQLAQSTTSAQTPTPTNYPKNFLKSRSFYGLWLCYMIGTFVGLSAIGISSPVGEEMIGINANVAATSVSLFALFNGLSRPLFGWLGDRFAPRYVAIGSYTLILIACILMVNAQAGQVMTYLVAFCLFWFCLGGWLALAPATTLRLFNPDDYAQNYGIVFTAYGVGALLGTLIAGQIRDWFGSYTYAFYPMGLLAIIGIFIASFMLKRDRQ